MLEASAFQALQAQAPYRGIIKPPVELVVHDLEGGVIMELKGSRTEQNLLTAFAGESQARNKYTYFALSLIHISEPTRRS